MCQARDHISNVTQRRVHMAAHERLDAIKSAVGGVFKGKGGAVKGGVRDKSVQADVSTSTLQSRMLLLSLAVLAFCLLLNQVGLFVPVVMVVRNCVMPKTPRLVRPKYPSCPAVGEGSLASEMTIVVSVKDACSQAPGFIRGLEVFAPPDVHLIYTYPNFESCAKIDLKEVLARWHKVTLLPLPLRSSPMQGWVDAIPYIKTKYSMLLHNDGYALDSRCELRGRSSGTSELDPSRASTCWRRQCLRESDGCSPPTPADQPALVKDDCRRATPSTTTIAAPRAQPRQRLQGRRPDRVCQDHG